jgi:hypothetical protein
MCWYQRDYRIVPILSLIFPLFIKGFLASVLMLTNEVIHRVGVHACMYMLECAVE